MCDEFIKSTKLKAMKKFSVLLVMIPLFTGFSVAQIQMESFDLPTLQVSTKRPVLFTKSGAQNVIISMYDTKSFVLNTPQISSKDEGIPTQAGPLLIVKISGIEYELEDISKSNLDVNWISKISVYEDGSARTLFGPKAENGVVIIHLAEDHSAKMIKLKNGRIVEFLDEIKKAESPFEIKILK